MSISFNNIGNLGRLSNQMFQYASLKGIARNRGFDFYMPPPFYFGSVDLNVRKSDANIYTVFNLQEKNKIGVTEYKLCPEATFNFDEDLFNNCSDEVDLFGYYQTDKYFSHIEDELREDFRFSDALVSQCRTFYEGSLGGQEAVAIHIRRGDYVHNPNHPLQPNEYYLKALSEFPSDLPVIVFSDDHEWCKNNPIFEDDRFYISENNATDFDLCLMSMCSFHIISNSSYGWWGSWLAQSKKTVAPSNWFGGELKGTKDPTDIYREGWVII